MSNTLSNATQSIRQYALAESIQKPDGDNLDQTSGDIIILENNLFQFRYLDPKHKSEDILPLLKIIAFQNKLKLFKGTNLYKADIILFKSINWN